jgi:hypothetical protein
MSATPTSLDPDLVKLEAEGYRLQVIHGASGAHLRAPVHDGRDSGVMADTIPAA